MIYLISALEQRATFSLGPYVVYKHAYDLPIWPCVSEGGFLMDFIKETQKTDVRGGNFKTADKRASQPDFDYTGPRRIGTGYRRHGLEGTACMGGAERD